MSFRSRTLAGINGLSMHMLEAGPDDGPLALLLHGFPELAFSWRHQLTALGDAGYHAVAPDQRGFGRTTGHDVADLPSFRLLNLARDAIGLAHALGHGEIALLVGHDFGSPVAGMLALARPDIVNRLVLMSAPFPGPPARLAPGQPRAPGPDAGLAALSPPRKHYQWHYSRDEADADLGAPPQGLTAFLRAYYHMKSGDWPENNPEPLPDWRPESLGRLPRYYVMDASQSMAETVAPHDPGIAPAWLPDHALAHYVSEYARTGFAGGLRWYRAVTSGQFAADIELFAGRAYPGPALFIAGERDWGIHQSPGTLEAMRTRFLADCHGVHLIPGAGHWVQQEVPEAVNRLLLDCAGKSV
jgi:pimeloyl-ACP methyl ester carboxylesterase